MSILSRLFKSSQLRDCEAALRLLRPSFGDALFYATIEVKVLKLIQKTPESVQKKMLIDGQSAQVTVLNAISNIAFRECAHGINHVYRGVLSMEGQSHRQTFSIATSKLVELNEIDQDAADEARANLAAAIKEVG